MITQGRRSGVTAVPAVHPLGRIGETAAGPAQPPASGQASWLITRTIDVAGGRVMC